MVPAMTDIGGRTGAPAKVTGLRFPGAGVGKYFRLLWALVLSVLCLGLGLLLLRLEQSGGAAGGFFPEVKGILFTVIGGILTLVAVVVVVAEPILSRRCWGQFLRPAAVVDAVGVRFALRGETVVITGRDIAEIRLNRTVVDNRSTGRRWTKTRVRLLLEPDADRNRDGLIRVPSTRLLTVGWLEDVVLPDGSFDVTDVPADLAVAFLREIAGPLLVITEKSRRLGRTTPLWYLAVARRTARGAFRRRTLERRGVTDYGERFPGS